MKTNAIRFAVAIFAASAGLGIAATGASASGEKPPMPGETYNVQPVPQAVAETQVARAKTTLPGQHGKVRTFEFNQIAQAPAPTYGK